MTRSFVRWCVLPLLVMGCSEQPPQGDACARYFKLYPDLNPDRIRFSTNAGFVDGMAHYNRGDHASAIAALSTYLERRDADKGAYLYLANSYLAIGKPYDAELQLDHLEQSNLAQFQDQAEWYTVLCLLCSDQTARALTAARSLANARAHTYKREAAELVKELEARPNP